jgi:glucokinase
LILIFFERMCMVFRYMTCLFLVIIGFCGIGKFFIKASESSLPINNDPIEFILCTKSSGAAVDYAVFSIHNNTSQLIHSAHINNENITNFTDAISNVLTHIKNDQGIEIHHACFAAPGVPSAEQNYLTHWRLPYVIDTKEIIKRTGLKTAIIVNDFLAMSYGVDFIDTKNITSLCDVPAELHGRRAIIGAVDGLGSVTMMWNESKNSYVSFPSEAGTGNFPAFNQFEFDLTENMKQMRNFSTAHWAFFVAVPGIQYTYKILKNMNQYPDALNLGESDGMTILAHMYDDELCKATADLFFKFYARFAYNFIWTTLPFGGLYLVGPTATEYPEKLSDVFLPEFFDCVASKKDLLKRIPIYVIHADVDLALHGAAQYLLNQKIIG